MSHLPFLLAYIDPNSGGMLFQLLAAAFVLLSGALFFFSSQVKMLWARFRRSWRERGHDQPSRDDESSAE
ncbi:MAG: hypothetical protein KA314_09625 [Chloroflexi bacterium]|nr:hypothetical protein [Chloroflexota bacterium]MBP8056090.1 hypothetical protein [Chloroflexota bacterium]